MRIPQTGTSCFLISLALSSSLCAFAGAQAVKGGPSDPRAQKTYAEALQWQKQGNRQSAIDSFRKANKQDGGHCIDCLQRAYNLALEINQFGTAISVVQDLLAVTPADPDKAVLHFWEGIALQREAIAEKNDKYFSQSCDEFKAALGLDPKLTTVLYSYGVSLAYLRQDDAARAEFHSFVADDTLNPNLHERAKRYVDHVELARAQMAPPFTYTALNGQQVSLDSLAGKVVLIDFWATWCAPCVAALPHVKRIVQQFQGQPFVFLSVSLDSDSAKWKDFVEKNGMNWPQYHEVGFGGPMDRLFQVDQIPATFSIDGEGVMSNQSLNDRDLENKLRKMIAQADELQKSGQAAEAR